MSLEFSDDLNFDLIDALDIRDAVKAAGEHVGHVAQSKAPILSGPDELKKANDQRKEEAGALRESMFVDPVDEHTVAVGFSAYWAAWQHERMDYHHTDGEAKFLERPLIEERGEALDIMAAHLAERLRSDQR